MDFFLYFLSPRQIIDPRISVHLNHKLQGLFHEYCQHVRKVGRLVSLIAVIYTRASSSHETEGSLCLQSQFSIPVNFASVTNRRGNAPVIPPVTSYDI